MLRPGLLAALGILVLDRLVMSLMAIAGTNGPSAAAVTTLPCLRAPIALALADGGRLLLAANQRSGTISIVDLAGRRVVAECPIGQSLSDLVAIAGDEDSFLCTDSVANKLQLIKRQGNDLKIVDTLGVSPFPVSICSTRDGRRCFVASLWSRRLTIVDLARDANKTLRLEVATVIPLSFAPRMQALSPDGKILVVADAFAGELGVINASQGKIESVRTIPGHNIRGLAWSADGQRLLITHQTLNRLAYTSPEDIHWGSVVSNVLRSLDHDAIRRPEGDVLAKSRLLQLGDVGNGAGDPASLAVTKQGQVIVALAGVGEVATGRLDSSRLHRLRVGVRPTALVASADGSELHVADTFGDSITTIKWNDRYPDRTEKEIIRVSLGPQTPLSAVDRGERLFFDARISHDNWMSCHSCHTDGQTSDGLSDTLGDGSFGSAKRIPPLGGVGQTAPWTWTGNVHSLADQVRKSATMTMHAKSITDAQVGDLTAYLKSLKPAPPVQIWSNAAERSGVERGRAVFSRQKCDRCHTPPAYSSPDLYDVGLRDDMGNRQFNPPSLRGVGQRALLFHDGRSDSLRAVFTVHRHPSNRALRETDLADLLTFLRSL